MLINVYHKDMSNEKTAVFEQVATVKTDIVGVMNALEYAYRWTNNVEGSWSSKEAILEYDGETYPNGDLNDNVEVTAPLPTHLGRTMGHRSTSRFDEMEIVETGERFRVAMCGFEKV